ncbi:MAG: LacI family DNA-binding transcriptional regulator [Anaerolineae bacterium]|nr:LacI family DNA-binding transcriptional regulator [Anaerolineae bacterium]
MPRKVTIQDISRVAGASPSTVSRVLTGNASVSPEKRLAIENAIKQLNYRPSHIARSLKTSTTMSVGLLLNEINNPFYSNVARGVEEVANQRGYSLILCNTNEDPERELQYLHVLQDKQVDGIILGPTGHNVEHIAQLAERTPLVQIDRQIESNKLSAVLVDNEEGGYQAVRAFINKGHRRIALFTWHKPTIPTIAHRRAGYERALREADLPIDPTLVVDIPELTPEHTAELTIALLRQPDPPTALFALNNRIALGVISAISQLGLKMPQEVSLIVFDDLDFFAVVKPAISAVAQPSFQMGEEAMRLLFRQIETPDCPAEIVILPTELILRETV